jgi:hypothetical protein
MTITLKYKAEDGLFLTYTYNYLFLDRSLSNQLNRGDSHGFQ